MEEARVHRSIEMQRNLRTVAMYAVITAMMIVTWQVVPAQTPPAPDYSSSTSWAALPGIPSTASATPPGYDDQQATAAVDVFYIHPTTYFDIAIANAAYNQGGIAQIGVTAALTNQASVFNGCCRIYAPHYRQASLGSDITASQASYRTFEIAYQDIKQAFLYYMVNYNQRRPFIIAGHSQGALHSERLIQELITGTPLQSQLVAAYVVGSSDPADPGQAGTFLGLPICNSPSQIGCSMSWDSYSQFGADTSSSSGAIIWADGSYRQSTTVPLCVSPLTWQRDTSTMATANLGGEPFSLTGSLSAPNSQLPGASCENGFLVIGPILTS